MPAPTRVPPLTDAVLRRVCDVLAATSGGLTNKEIANLLQDAGIPDPTPRDAGPGTYVMVNKRDRLHTALAEAQRQTGASNHVVWFIRAAMHPARYDDNPGLLAERRERINVALAFASLELREDNRMQRVKPAATLSEAQRRARQLQSILKDRGAHPRLLAACVDEIADENYFHAVLEAAKSLAEEIRQRTGSRLDGRTAGARNAADHEQGPGSAAGAEQAGDSDRAIPPARPRSRSPRDLLRRPKSHRARAEGSVGNDRAGCR